MTNTAIVPVDSIDSIVRLVTDGLTSAHSRRAYSKALDDFLTWYAGEGRPGLSKATVQRYGAVLAASGLSPSTINLRLSAVRRLAAEAADNGLIDPVAAGGIARVKGVKSAGVRAGNWLTKEQAQRLLDAPNVATLKGLRDRGILAVMLGAGLRRSEVAALTVEHVQQREGRWLIVDMRGKGGRVRSVPIASWVKVAIDAWTSAAGITSGVIFRAIHRGGHVNGETMTAQAVADVVGEYGRALGYSIAAHDLRRTFAKLALKGGAGIEQISISLGHAGLATTERYLGITLDLTDAPGDRLGLRI